MCVEVSLAGIYGRSLYIQHVQQWYVPEFSTPGFNETQKTRTNKQRGERRDFRQQQRLLSLLFLLREYQHDDTIQWIAAPKLTEIVEVENETWQGAKLTEIVEVENETWQGAKFGVC